MRACKQCGQEVIENNIDDDLKEKYPYFCINCNEILEDSETIIEIPTK